MKQSHSVRPATVSAGARSRHLPDGLRPTAVAWGVSLALLALAAPAQADSGNGADTALGNSISPAGVSSMPRTKDREEGETPETYRTPTGMRVEGPNVVREGTRTASGWVYTGSIEAGGLAVHGEKNAALFKTYRDLKSGPYVSAFGVELEKPATAQFFELFGGGVGRDDQFYGVQFGRYNDWRVKLFYSETPHVFTTTYRNIYNGTGSANLTLATLAPGGTTSAVVTNANIAAAVLGTPYSELSVIRKKGGVRADLSLTEQWKVFAAYSNEKREGARPFGFVTGGGGGTGGVEIPESVNYDTHDFLAGASFNDARQSFNLQASASLFRNNVGTMTVQNPLFLAAANGLSSFPTARYDLYPNNDYYNVKGEYARAFPEFMKSRITAVASLATSRQNDSLIPYTAMPGVTINGVAGGGWDTVASLSKTSADARIDTRLFDFGWAFKPLDALDMRVKARHYETINSTEFWVCNPLTGQWGRVINDGSGSAVAGANTTAGVNPTGTLVTAYDGKRCDLDAVRALNLVPSAGNLAIRNIPFAHKQTNLSVSGDYQLARGQSLAFNYDNETIDRDHRERAQTWEDRLKLSYVNRSLADGTLRLSAEGARRRGSAYMSDPYDEFYSAALGPAPTASGVNVTSWIHINDLHRKFDLADRDQFTLNAKFNYAITPEVDLAVTGQVRDANFPNSDYGRSGTQAQRNVNVDLNWQIMPTLNVYGYVSHIRDTMNQRGIQQNACVIGTTYYFFSDGSIATAATRTAAQVAAGITVVGSTAVTGSNWADVCGTASATSPLYPTSRAWTVTQKGENTSLGLGARYDWTKAVFDGSYSFARGRTSYRYTYNPAALGLVTSGAATAAQTTTLGLIGDGFADSTYRQHVFNLNVAIPINKRLALRLLGRLEIGKIYDWHYDGLAQYPVPSNNQQTYLDAGPQNYRVSFVGALLKYDF